VEIMSVAREPGHRSKIAVSSNEPGVDPVGACVGAKGSRVRMVVNELKGEKIDVVEWSQDPGKFVANALQPAKVSRVRIDPESQTALVVVPDYQLSLAIGKEGQNARLAARLTGWRIDIKSESQVAEEESRARQAPAAPSDEAEPEEATEPAAAAQEAEGEPAEAEPAEPEAAAQEAEPDSAEPEAAEAEPAEADPEPDAAAEEAEAEPAAPTESDSGEREAEPA
jgi:N utilization substance protein A